MRKKDKQTAPPTHLTMHAEQQEMNNFLLICPQEHGAVARASTSGCPVASAGNLMRSQQVRRRADEIAAARFSNSRQCHASQNDRSFIGEFWLVRSPWLVLILIGTTLALGGRDATCYSPHAGRTLPQAGEGFQVIEPEHPHITHIEKARTTR